MDEVMTEPIAEVQPSNESTADPHAGLAETVATVATAVATYPKSATCSKCGGDAFDTGAAKGQGPSLEHEVKCADEACGWIGYRLG